jgi:predicted AAA+ superfamily ATPase
VINEIIKKYYNSGRDATVYFYRDKHGNEVDALLTVAREMISVEIKSSETYHSEFAKSLDYFIK